MKRRNDQSTYKFNGAIATISLQFCHIFYLSCIKFLLKVCSNHGIIGMDYFILRHGHFVHGYYILVDIHQLNQSWRFGSFFITNSEYWESLQILLVSISQQYYHCFSHLDNRLICTCLFLHTGSYL